MKVEADVVAAAAAAAVVVATAVAVAVIAVAVAAVVAPPSCRQGVSRTSRTLMLMTDQRMRMAPRAVSPPLR